MCPYSELFWSAFFCIWTEYGEIRSIESDCGKMRTRTTPNSLQLRENADHKNSEYGQFSRIDTLYNTYFEEYCLSNGCSAK